VLTAQNVLPTHLDFPTVERGECVPWTVAWGDIVPRPPSEGHGRGACVPGDTVPHILLSARAIAILPYAMSLRRSEGLIRSAYISTIGISGRSAQMSPRFSRRSLVVSIVFSTTMTWPKTWKDKIFPVTKIVTCRGTTENTKNNTINLGKASICKPRKILWNMENISNDR
jgi:hypothetical protein